MITKALIILAFVIVFLGWKIQKMEQQVDLLEKDLKKLKEKDGQQMWK